MSWTARAGLVVSTLGLVGGAVLAGLGAAPIAAAVPLSYCGYEHEFSEQVMSATTPLQTAASRKGWQWSDPDVQQATGAVLDSYPKLDPWVNTLATVNANHSLQFGLWAGNVANGDYNGDAQNLQGAMSNLQGIVQDANNPAAVLPATQAVLTSLRALDSDCVGIV